MNTIKGRIKEVIRPNGIGAITASEHQALLLEVVDDVNKKKQDVIEDLDAIREGAQKGATAAQDIKTINEELGKKVNSSDLATINGQRIDEGGNIEIEGGMSEDEKAELNEKLTELSEETKYITLTDIPLKNAYFNGMNLKVGDSFTSSEGTSSVVSCAKIQVKEGEVYRLKGKCNTYAYKGWWIVNENNIVTRIIGDVESYDIDLTIQVGESKLYVNCLNYDATTDKVQKVETLLVKERVRQLEGNVRQLEGNVKQLEENVKQLEEEKDNEYVESISLNKKIVPGFAYNLSGIQVGNVYTNTPASSATSAYIKSYVNEGSKYVIRGIGSQYAFRLYAFFDKDMRCLEVSSGAYDTRNNALTLTPPSNAKAIIVNFTNYDSVLDSLIQETSYSVASPKLQPLQGKRIVCFGDSITQFDSAIGMRYSDYLELSGASIVNVGVGGTQLRQRATPSANPTSVEQAYGGLDIASLVNAAASNDYSIVEASASYIQSNAAPSFNPIDVIERLKSIDWNKVDIVTILGGTNDWLNGNNLGEATDENATSTLGALNHIIKTLLTAYPHLRVYVFTPLVRYVASSLAERTDAAWAGTKTNGEGKNILDYVDAIKYVAENNCIPVCDMYHTLGWNKWNFSQYFNDGDGTHPYKGFRQIAERMQSFILSNW